jgi:hypothetical protein
MAEQFTGSASNLAAVGRFYLRKHSEEKLKQGKILDALIVPMFRAWAGQKAWEDFMADKWHLVEPVVKKLGVDMPKILRGLTCSQDGLNAALTVKKLMEIPEGAAGMSGEGEFSSTGEGEGEANPFQDQEPDESKEGNSGMGEGKDKPETEEPTDDGKNKSGDKHDSKPSDKKDKKRKSKKASKPESETEKPEEKKEESAREEGEDKDEKGPSDDDEKSDASGEGDESAGRDADDDAAADEDAGGEGGEGEGEGVEDEGVDGADESSDGDAGGEGEDGGVKESDDGSEGSDEAGTKPSIGEDNDEMPTPETLSKAAEEAEYDEALADAISKKAQDAAENTEYLIYTQDYDRVYPFDEQCEDGWLKEIQDAVDHMVGTLQKDLERAVAARSASVWTGGHRNGKLHNGSLHRLMFNRDDVFRRKQVNDSKSVAASIVIDISGSMRWGTKLQLAAWTGYALASVLDRMGIPNEVICFTTKPFPRTVYKDMERDPLFGTYARIEALDMPILKGFDERMTVEAKRRFAALDHRADCQNNVDGECVQIAARRLSLRREKRKILFVLSDGHPACSGGKWTALLTHLKAVCEQIEKSGIDVMGIGIMDRAVQQFYKRHVVLNAIQDLPGECIRQLKDLLLKAKLARGA